jgi:hypothetical protein
MTTPDVLRVEEGMGITVDSRMDCHVSSAREGDSEGKAVGKKLGRGVSKGVGGREGFVVSTLWHP